MWTQVPMISLIVPCYNAARTLSACLRSVRQQCIPIKEVLVVDDASVDGSAELAERLDCTVIRLPVNGGVSAARNAGAAAATGEILFFADADGALAPDAVANAVRLLLADPEYACVQGMYGPDPLVDDGPVERYKTLHGYLWRRRSVGRVRTAIFALAAIRRDAFQAVGGFDERLRDSEDVEFSTRFGRRFGILLTETVTGWHDDVDRLVPMLREQLRRSRLLPSMMLIERRTRAGGGIPAAPTERTEESARPLVANRAPTVLCGAMTVASGLLAVPTALWSPWALAVPMVCLLAFVVSDLPMVRGVVAHRGVRFLGVFLGLHLLVQATIVAGALLGVVREVAGPTMAAAEPVKP